MPRPSPLSKIIGSLSPSLCMYSNVKSKKISHKKEIRKKHEELILVFL